MLFFGKPYNLTKFENPLLQRINKMFGIPNITYSDDLIVKFAY